MTMSNVARKISLDGIDRAAVLMMSLGTQDAAVIMKHLSPRQVQKLGVAMASLKNVERREVTEVLGDFINVVANETSLGVNSDEYIKEVLINALGKERAGSVVDRILLGASAKGLESLKWLDARGISEVIRHEHPQIQAIVLSYLEADIAAQILSLFTEQQRLDLVMRISTLDAIHPRALQELNEVMEQQFSGANNTQSATKVGGLKTAAEIMNFLDRGIEEKLITQVGEKDQKIAQSIQDLMFVFDNLLSVSDRDIQLMLREVNTESLLVALKGADPLVKEKIFVNMSKRAAEMLRDDLEARGPIRLKDAEAAQKEILMVARRLAEEGKINLGGAGEAMV
jgi:flagellar motor switch protein FliG